MSEVPVIPVPPVPKPGSWRESALRAVAKAFDLFFGQPATTEPPFIIEGVPSVPKGTSSPIRRLSPDILIDDIFPYLLIDELLSLRQTCKAFYLLTHETVIWKRYLRWLKLPIALLRPTFEYDKRVSNYEIESIVTSACAIERAWRLGCPRVHQEALLTSQCQVVDMRLVPGGKFLVASIKDRSNYRFFILVYALGVLDGSRLIARIPTLYKAYDLQAKYMTYDDRPGIMIYYTRRRFLRGVPKNRRDNINEFHPRTQYPTKYRMIYEPICIHMRLDSVEKLIYPEFGKEQYLRLGDSSSYVKRVENMPPPFVNVFHRTTQCEIHSPSLSIINQDPVLWLAEDTSRGSVVAFRNLRKNQEGEFTLVCKDAEGFEGLPHRIRAMRYIPNQKCILVIRSTCFRPQGTETILVEIYDIPRSSGEHEVRPWRRWSFEDQWSITKEFVISDDDDMTLHTPYHPHLVNHRNKLPPTITVFAASENPKGCVQFSLRPMKDEFGRWLYTRFVSPRVHHNLKGHYERTLAGSFRSIILEVDDQHLTPTKLIKMRRFFFSEWRYNDEGPRILPTNNPLIADWPEEINNAYTDIISSQDFGHAVNEAGGMVAAAWDEMSGKICVAAEKDDFIRVLNIAPIVQPHSRLAYRWHLGLVDPDLEPMDYIALPWPSLPEDDNDTEGSSSSFVAQNAGGSSSTVQNNDSNDVVMRDTAQVPLSPEPKGWYQTFVDHMPNPPMGIC